MSALEKLSAIGDGADQFARAAIQVMVERVSSGKVNFADVLPKHQKFWQKVPLLINDIPLDEQCRTLLNMSNGNRKIAIRMVIEGRFEASPQVDEDKDGASNVSSFVDSMYSANGLSMAGYVTKQVLNFVLPGIGSQAEAVAYLLRLHKQGLELFMWLKTTFWCTLRNVALIALLRGQRLEDRNVQDLLVWCFLQRTPADASVQQSNLEALVSRIFGSKSPAGLRGSTDDSVNSGSGMEEVDSGTTGYGSSGGGATSSGKTSGWDKIRGMFPGGTEQGVMEKIKTLFPDDAGQWKRAVLERANSLFAPRKRFVMAEVAAMLLLWLLPVLVGIADTVAKIVRTLDRLPWGARAALATTIAGAIAAAGFAYHANPGVHERILKLHPLTLFAKYPSFAVFAILLCIPGVLHITNAHRFGVAALEFLEMLPPFLNRFTARALHVDEADQTLTLVVSFSPPALLRVLHRNARVAQAFHVLAICSCSFLKILLKASYARVTASPEGRRKRYISKLGRFETALVVAMLLWPLLVLVEVLWFDDLDPYELVLRDGKVWWLVKYAAKICAVVIEVPLWNTLMSADFLAQFLTAKNVVQGVFASVGAFWYIFYLSRQSQTTLKTGIESLTPSSLQCTSIVVSRRVAFTVGLLLAFVTSKHWGLPSALDAWVYSLGGNVAVVVSTRGLAALIIFVVVLRSYRAYQREAGANLSPHSVSAGSGSNDANDNDTAIEVTPKGHWRRLLTILPPGIEWLDEIPRYLESLDDLMNSPGRVSELEIQPKPVDADSGSCQAICPPGVELTWKPSQGAECYEVCCAPYGVLSGRTIGGSAASNLVAKFLPPSKRRGLGGDGTLATKPAWEPRCSFTFDELIAMRTNSFGSTASKLTTTKEKVATAASNKTSGADAFDSDTQTDAHSRPKSVAAVAAVRRSRHIVGSQSRTGSRNTLLASNADAAAFDLVFRVRGVSTKTGVKLAGPWSEWSSVVWGRQSVGTVQFSDRDIPDVLPAGLDEFTVAIRQMIGIPGAMSPWDDVQRCPNDIVGIFESSVDEADTTSYAKRGLMKNWSWHYVQSAKLISNPQSDRLARKQRRQRRLQIEASQRQHTQDSSKLDHVDGVNDVAEQEYDNDQCVWDDGENLRWYGVTFARDQLPSPSGLVTPRASKAMDDRGGKALEASSEDLGDFDNLEQFGETSEDVSVSEKPQQGNQQADQVVEGESNCSSEKVLSTYEFRYISAQGNVMARSRPFSIRPLSVHVEVSSTAERSGNSTGNSGARSDHHAGDVTLFAVWESFAKSGSSLATDIEGGAISTISKAVPPPTTSSAVVEDLDPAASPSGSNDADKRVESMTIDAEQCASMPGPNYVEDSEYYGGCISFRFCRSRSFLTSWVGKWTEIPSTKVSSVLVQHMPSGSLSGQQLQRRVIAYTIPGGELEAGMSYLVQVRYHDPDRQVATKWSRSVSFTFNPPSSAPTAATAALGPLDSTLNTARAPLSEADSFSQPLRGSSGLKIEHLSGVNDAPGADSPLSLDDFQLTISAIRVHTAMCVVSLLPTDKSMRCEAAVDHFELNVSTTNRLARWGATINMVGHACPNNGLGLSESTSFDEASDQAESHRKTFVVASALLKDLSERTKYMLRVRPVYPAGNDGTGPTKVTFGSWMMAHFSTLAATALEPAMIVSAVKPHLVSTNAGEFIAHLQCPRSSREESGSSSKADCPREFVGIEVQLQKKTGYMRNASFETRIVEVVDKLPLVSAAMKGTKTKKCERTEPNTIRSSHLLGTSASAADSCDTNHAESDVHVLGEASTVSTDQRAFLLRDLVPGVSYNVRARLVVLCALPVSAAGITSTEADPISAAIHLLLAEQSGDSTCFACVKANTPTSNEAGGAIAARPKGLDSLPPGFSNVLYQEAFGSALDSLSYASGLSCSTPHNTCCSTEAPTPETDSARSAIVSKTLEKLVSIERGVDACFGGESVAGFVAAVEKGSWSSTISFSTLAAAPVPTPVLSVVPTRPLQMGTSFEGLEPSDENSMNDTVGSAAQIKMDGNGPSEGRAPAAIKPASVAVGQIAVTVAATVSLPLLYCEGWRPALAPIGGLEMQFSSDSRFSFWKTVPTNGVGADHSGASSSSAGSSGSAAEEGPGVSVPEDSAESFRTALVELSNFVNEWQLSDQQGGQRGTTCSDDGAESHSKSPGEHEVRGHGRAAPPTIKIDLPPLKSGSSYLVRAYFKSLKTTAFPTERSGEWGTVVKIDL